VSLKSFTQQDKPFWIWNKQQHKQEDIKTSGDCCFNHIIDLPQKDRSDKPLYDYEQIMFDLYTNYSNANGNHLLSNMGNIISSSGKWYG
jgi:hypothetical protein